MEDMKIMSTEEALKFFDEKPTLETVSATEIKKEDIPEIYKK